MSRKPIIAYIESDRSRSLSDDNPNRDALSYFLREHCGCEVVQYRYDCDFQEDLPRLKKYSDCHQLILVIVKQEEYSDQHKQVLQLVRGKLSATLPVVVIPDGWGDKRFGNSSDDNSVHVFDHTDTELVELVNRLVAEWKPPYNWLGAETAEDQATLTAQLENAYRKHYLGDDNEGMFGTPDHNHMIIAEALRLRLLPAEFLKSEFDDTIEEVRRVFASTKSSVYKREVAKIRKMTDEERKAFSHTLQRARGYEPAEGGGVYVTRASCGNNVNGFAIDPVTLETHITYRFGEHHLCGDMLARRIQAIEALRNRKHLYELDDEKERECRWRLITGLIFSEIDGFATSLLQLYTGEADKKQIRQVVRFLHKQQKFIPVDHDGQLIEG